MTKDLRLQLLRAVVRDRSFLRQAWRDVRPESFPEIEEQIIAQAATNYFEKYEEPIGPLLRTDVDDLSRRQKLGAEKKQKLRELTNLVVGTKLEAVSVKALIDRVKSLRRASFYDDAVQEIIIAQDKGELTATTLADLVERANKELADSAVVVHDYFEEGALEKRIAIRAQADSEKYPDLLIPELDRQICGIGLGHLGMWMAPPGGGKGLALVHTDLALALQGHRVLHFTLEDPIDLVEKRLDANLTGLPLAKLRLLPNKLRKRFRRARRTMRGRIKVVDATDGTWSVSKIEQFWEQEKQHGFQATAIVIDYDDEIVCEKQFKGESARRFEFHEVYRRLRAFAAKTHTIVWTAAQTSKGAVGKRIITSKDTAEDFSKIRKVFLCVTIGSDLEEDPNMRYLYVAKHRLDRGHFGVEIMSDYSRAIFYDAEASARRTAVRKHMRRAA